MGVKHLWSILSPVCERKSLWDIQDKYLAIDLSGWVCDSQNISDGNRSQPQMYLRNLFFRTNCLLILGAHPVFVLEGKAPEIKYDVIDKRRNNLNKNNGLMEQASKKRVRSYLNSLLKKCEKLLEIMGLTCVRSPGEAEALCASLNQNKVVDGCVSQDGDCFLYGASTVYRNFCISPVGGGAGFCVDVYSMQRVEERLALGREKLVAMALLCGCDYGEVGVGGVGKERVLSFLASDALRAESILDRMKRWRSDSYFDDLEEQKLLMSKGKICDICGHNGSKKLHLKVGCAECGKTLGCIQGCDYSLNQACAEELFIRKKALLDPEFPSAKIIGEFFNSDANSHNIVVDKSWKKPDLHEFVKFATTSLGWTDEYAVAKFLPLMTRWQLTECCKGVTSAVFFEPESIIKKRIVKGVKSYEIKWVDINDIVKRVKPDISIITVEPEWMVAEAYSSIVKTYLGEKEEKIKQGKKKNKAVKVSKTERKRGREAGIQKSIDKYFTGSENINKTSIFQLSDDERAVHARNHCLSREPKENKEMDASNHCQSVFSEPDKECTSTPLRGMNKFMSPVCSPLCKYRKETEEWEGCHVCYEDDDMDISAIVTSILNKKTSLDFRKEFLTPVPSTFAIKVKENNTLESDFFPDNASHIETLGKASPMETPGNASPIETPVNELLVETSGNELPILLSAPGNENSEESNFGTNESVDEFDLLIEEDYVPLLERIKLKI